MQTKLSLNHRIGLDKVHYDLLSNNYYRYYESDNILRRGSLRNSFVA